MHNKNHEVMVSGAEAELAFCIYIKLPAPRMALGWTFEQIEDDLANFMAKYGFEGRIEDDITGNITAFPIQEEINEEGYEPGKDDNK